MSLLTTSSLMQRLDQVAYPSLFIPIVWVVSSILSSVAGGWFALSRRFSSRTGPTGEVHTVRSFFRPAYSRLWVHEVGIRITAATDALYLSVYFPFRLGRPPLRIPWDEITFSKSSESPPLGRRPFVFREYVILTLGKEERIPLRVSSRAALELGILDRVPGGVAIDIEPNFDKLPDDFPDPTLRKPQ